MTLAMLAISEIAAESQKTEKSGISLNFGQIIMAIFGVLLAVSLLLAVIFKDRNQPFQVPIDDV